MCSVALLIRTPGIAYLPHILEGKNMEAPMTVKVLSEYLKLDRMTIYKMLKEGKIPASRIGKQWRFFRKEIDAWIRSKRVGPDTTD